MRSVRAHGDRGVPSWKFAYSLHNPSTGVLEVQGVTAAFVSSRSTNRQRTDFKGIQQGRFGCSAQFRMSFCLTLYYYAYLSQTSILRDSSNCAVFSAPKGPLRAWSTGGVAKSGYDKSAHETRSHADAQSRVRQKRRQLARCSYPCGMILRLLGNWLSRSGEWSDCRGAE